MLQFQQISKAYNNQVILDIDQLEIPVGSTVGLVGNNGAGKTTFMSLILDLIPATTGNVYIEEKDVSKSGQWKAITGSFIDSSFLVPFLSPMEYLEFIGSLHQISKAEIESFLETSKDFFEVGLFQEKKLIRDLSKGNTNKIGILAALMIQPKLLLLDEPFSNLDPTSQSWLKNKLTELKKQAMTIVVSSHDLKHVTEVCDQILILEEGKIVKNSVTNAQTLQDLEKYFAVR